MPYHATRWQLNDPTMLFYAALLVLLAFMFLAPQHAFASEGTGGLCPTSPGWRTCVTP